ncbi:MAG TPA: SUMF1/EgtB/PvdO family nonheme iron enzyme [Mesotoga infera]|nr:SUMF1/EgtB/PvdO family nonheme iron enzyme [Mesotoga infera]
MNNEARKQLIEIVKRYGIKILDEPRKVEGLLKDFCGDCKKEIFSIVNALKERAGNDLMNSSKSNTVKITIGRLSSKMQSDLGMSEEVAVWSIESIAIALGIMSEKEAIGARKAQVEQKPVETKTGATYRQDSRESEIKTSNGDELIYVEGGSFVMGDTWGDGDSDEKPTHKVELTYDFYIGKYPVTFEEYDRYCSETGATKPYVWNWGRGRRPVIRVSWFDAIGYCDWLSDVEGLARAYDNAGNLIDSRGNETIDTSKVKGYRLLTEAEWEYAARGGKKSRRNKYAGSNNPDEVAWYTSNSRHKTQEVGKKAPNELGIYDMSGNVWEWCSDWYGNYSSSAQTNPYNNSGSGRVGRGGGWGDDAAGTRVAGRGYDSPSRAYYYLGFRICRTVF